MFMLVTRKKKKQSPVQQGKELLPSLIDKVCNNLLYIIAKAFCRPLCKNKDHFYLSTFDSRDLPVPILYRNFYKDLGHFYKDVGTLGKSFTHS